jgi:hypothetical protein
VPDVSGRTVICLRSSTIGIILDELFHWGLVYRTGPIPGFSTFRPSSKGGCIAVHILGRMMDARNSMIIGLLLLPLGLLFIIATILLQSRAGLVFGCVITGGAQGFGWMGSSERVARLAPSEQRASVMSAFYIVAYAGVALPVLAVGVGADWVGLPTAVSTLAVAVTVTALSLVAHLLRPRRVLTVSGE